MNLAALDLNLLVVFDALMNERHATRAGQRIGLSQPAISKALNRLRALFDDELFVRTADGMQPTHRAIELAGPISKALRQIEQALTPGEFDPATAEGITTIITNDLVASTVLPEFLHYLEEHAPGIDIRLKPSLTGAFEHLDRQEADIAITATTSHPDRFVSETVLQESFVVLMRAGHPLAQLEMTPDVFASARHIMVSVTGDGRGDVDTILEGLGLSRRIGITLNHFAAGPPILAATDLLMICPSGLAGRRAQQYGLIMKPVPFELPPLFGLMRMIWLRRASDTPSHRWVRQALIETFNNYRKA